MARYFARGCPRCKHYLGLTMRDSPVKRPVQALNGQCLACGYWFAWLVISGKSEGTTKWPTTVKAKR